MIDSIKYLLIFLPKYIFEDATEMFSKFLKEKNIYTHWDKLHSLLVVLIIVAVTLYFRGVY